MTFKFLCKDWEWKHHTHEYKRVKIVEARGIINLLAFIFTKE